MRQEIQQATSLQAWQVWCDMTSTLRRFSIGVAMAAIHVYPANDLIDHDTEDDDCLCGPETEAVLRDDGSYGWLILHHSLDGRESIG